VNYFFKFGGPSMSVDTACSSSAVALNLACNSIWSNECDTALAGGMMLLTSPDTFCGLSKGHFLSTTGQCKTFDDKADGYCRGEAVASVVVKRLSAAQADNDKILGLILSAGTNYSAKSVSITHPHSATQETLYKRLLAEAGLDPFDVDYVEMHGTGTQAGDAAEMASVSNVFAPSSTPRPRQHPLYLGSAKANLGHGESVSGVTALMKIMLVLREQQIPPHIGIKSGTINHSFPGLDERNIRIAMGSTDFPCQQSRRRRVLLNNFGAAGGNTALLLEEAPLTKAGASHDPRCDHIVTISAKRPESLRKNIENMIEYLDKQPEVSLSDLSYTTTARRIQHSYRVAVVASSISDLRDRLSVALQSHEYKPHAKSPRVALVFTGQGSFHIPLAKTLYETCTQFREDVQRFDNLSRDHGFLSMLGAVDGTISEANDLCATQTQLALTTVQMALYRLYATWGVKYTVVVGHSLGEYAALYASGVLSASDALYLVGRRATLLEASCTRGTHSMLAVNASAETLRKMLGERFNLLEITCRNGPVDIVLGGPDSQVKDIKEYLDSQGVQCTILAIPYAFHSSQVEPLLDSFEEAAAGVVYCDPTCPLASPLLGSVIRDSGIIGPEYLRRHARETVDFHKAVEAIDKEDLCDKDTVWLELGPSAVCLKMIKSILGPQSEGACVLKAREDPWTTACRALSLLYTRGLALSWSEYHRDFEAGQQLLHLPSYAFEETNYYIEYKGDWALRKGDDLANAPTTLSVPARSGPGTSSVQRLISRDIVGGKSVMVFETDLSDPALHHMIAGHVMNGVALCPAGVFADMALTIGEFVTRDKCSSVPPSGINVTDMEIVKGLVVPALRPDQPQLVRLEATTDFERGSVHVVISELSHDRKSAGCNVKCVVRYGEHHTWLKEWARTAYLISKRIEHLELDAKAGSTARLPRSLVYKLFSTVVNYSQGYQGIYEALINVEELEAAATIHFQQDRHGGEFTNSPIWIDNLAQLSGFLMNATGITNSLKEVFIAQGWESFQIAQEIDPAKEYRVHLKMRDLTRGLYVGDTSILQDGQMVGLIGGIKFQKLSRRTMDAVLKVSPSDSHQSTRHSPSESPKVMQPRTKALSEHVQANVPDSKVWVNTTKDEAFAIFAQEVGMSIAELSDTTSLSDLGVDSLLSLTILAKLRERLGIDVPQSAFQDCESVRDLRQLISTCTSQETALHDNNEDTSSSESSKIYTPPARGTPGKAESVTIDLNTVYTVIADQIGVSVTELLAANDFEALGVDSLMSLSILGSLRESLGLDVQPDMMQGTFSLDTIKSEFERCFPSKQPVNLSSAEDVTHPTPKAKSVLLQGNAKSADKTLFLFPDGSGSASSYINLPNIPEDICVFGIDSPFLRRADEYTCTLEEASRIMLNEVRRRQPTGPYLLAGWSAGGMYAYEAARLLIASGEKVEKLILIDSPCRLLHGAMPQDVLDFVSQSGVITAKNNGAAPEWLIKHFSATIEAVKRYSPQAIESSVAPDTFLIWASKGVFEDFGKTTKIDLSDSVATWLLQPKPSPGSQGWDRLLCPERVWSTSVSGNHFSMVHPPEVSFLFHGMDSMLI
jgi:iterative type I PKS product template protein